MNTPRQAERPLFGVAAEKSGGGWVDAARVAAHLGVSRCWVYEHAGELGACRLGSGPKARLRFTLEQADEYLASCSAGRWPEQPAIPVSKPKQRRSTVRPTGSRTELLPIRGREAA